MAGDGRVTNWTIVKVSLALCKLKTNATSSRQTTLWHSDKLVLKYSKQLSIGDNLADHLVEAPRAIAFKPDDENIFLVRSSSCHAMSRHVTCHVSRQVGTEEGDIYLATTEFSTEFLMQYCSHSTPINSLAWNPHYSGGGAGRGNIYLPTEKIFQCSCRARRSTRWRCGTRTTRSRC